MTYPRSLAPAALLAVLAVACGGDVSDDAVDVTAACDRLETLAETYDDKFMAWRTGDGIGAREAGGDADIALDRAGARCLELGATNDFPQQP
jgi:hypothetical protein